MTLPWFPYCTAQGARAQRQCTSVSCLWGQNKVRLRSLQTRPGKVRLGARLTSPDGCPCALQLRHYCCRSCNTTRGKGSLCSLSRGCARDDWQQHASPTLGPGDLACSPDDFPFRGPAAGATRTELGPRSERLGVTI